MKRVVSVILVGALTFLAPAQAFASSLYFVHTDHQGSVVAITSDNGASESATRYYPYGEDRYTNEATPTTERRYTSQIKDEETDVYYYNARYYDPEIGSFLSADPTNDQINRYAYVAGNPINYTDSLGNRINESALEEDKPVFNMEENKQMFNLFFIDFLRYNIDFDEFVGISDFYSTTKEDLFSDYQNYLAENPGNQEQALLQTFRENYIDVNGILIYREGKSWDAITNEAFTILNESVGMLRFSSLSRWNNYLISIGNPIGAGGFAEKDRIVLYDYSDNEGMPEIQGLLNMAHELQHYKDRNSGISGGPSVLETRANETIANLWWVDLETRQAHAIWPRLVNELRSYGLSYEKIDELINSGEFYDYCVLCIQSGR